MPGALHMICGRPVGNRNFSCRIYELYTVVVVANMLPAGSVPAGFCTWTLYAVPSCRVLVWYFTLSSMPD